MKASASQIRQALQAPRPATRLYLLHGPDEAGAEALARLLGQAMGDGAERVDLDGPTLKGDPARLADEAASMSLFGDKRWIRVTGVGEESLDAVTALLEAERAGNPVVAIAPSMKASAKVVKLALDSPAALAFACYAPSGQEAEKLAIAIAGEQGMRVAPGIAARLAAASGNDRAVLAREVDKLASFLDAAPDRPRDLDHAALDAIGADIEDADTGVSVEAIIDGRPDALAVELARMADTGGSPIPWLRHLVRRLTTLAEMRDAVARGESPDAVIKRHRVFWKEEESTARALRRWSPAMLADALVRARVAERAVMASANAGPVLADAAMLSLARQVARRG